jgi:hypothetical protein
MIRVFFGDDRALAVKQIKRLLGDDYEVIEGENIDVNMVAPIFLGASLFEEKRKILIRDLSANLAAFEQVTKYTQTKNEVIIFETKFDKRLKVAKELAKAGIELREFKKLEKINSKEIFNVFNLALTGQNKRAVTLLRCFENDEDPMAYIGLLTTQAIRELETKGGTRERKIIKKLSKLDMDTKSSKFEAWDLVESFLLTI